MTYVYTRMFPQQPELSLPVAIGLVLVTLVVDLAAVLVLVRLASRYRGRSRPSPGAGTAEARDDAAAGAAADTPDGSTVACPACGAANEPEYQYCRACVARLPGAASATRSDLPSFGRFAD